MGLLSALTTSLFFITPNPLSLIVFYTLTGVTMGMYPAALVAYVFGKKGRLGRFSSFGSLGSGLDWIVAGVVSQSLGIRMIFLLSAVIFLASFLISIGMPKIPTERHNVPLFSSELFKRSRVVFVVFLMTHWGEHSLGSVPSLFGTARRQSCHCVSTLRYKPSPTIPVHVLGYGPIAPKEIDSSWALILIPSILHNVSSNQYLAYRPGSVTGGCFVVMPLRGGAEKRNRDVRKVTTTTRLLNSVIQMGNSVGPLV